MSEITVTAEPQHQPVGRARPGHADAARTVTGVPAQLLHLQRTAGNAAVMEALEAPCTARSVGVPVVQRDPPTAAAVPTSWYDRVQEALTRVDPVAGVGDYPAVWRILN